MFDANSGNRNVIKQDAELGIYEVPQAPKGNFLTRCCRSCGKKKADQPLLPVGINDARQPELAASEEVARPRCAGVCSCFSQLAAKVSGCCSSCRKPECSCLGRVVAKMSGCCSRCRRQQAPLDNQLEAAAAGRCSCLKRSPRPRRGSIEEMVGNAVSAAATQMLQEAKKAREFIPAPGNPLYAAYPKRDDHSVVVRKNPLHAVYEQVFQGLQSRYLDPGASALEIRKSFILATLTLLQASFDELARQGSPFGIPNCLQNMEILRSRVSRLSEDSSFLKDEDPNSYDAYPELSAFLKNNYVKVTQGASRCHRGGHIATGAMTSVAALGAAALWYPTQWLGQALELFSSTIIPSVYGQDYPNAREYLAQPDAFFNGNPNATMDFYNAQRAGDQLSWIWMGAAIAAILFGFGYTASHALTRYSAPAHPADSGLTFYQICNLIFLLMWLDDPAWQQSVFNQIKQGHSEEAKIEAEPADDHEAMQEKQRRCCSRRGGGNAQLAQPLLEAAAAQPAEQWRWNYAPRWFPGQRRIDVASPLVPENHQDPYAVLLPQKAEESKLQPGAELVDERL